MSFALERAQPFTSDKGHFYEENVNIYWTVAMGTMAKAQGTTAIAVCAVGSFEAGLTYRILARSGCNADVKLHRAFWISPAALWKK